MNDEMNQNVMFAALNAIIALLTEHVNDDEEVRPDQAATIAASLNFCLQTAAEMQLQAKETDERRYAVIQRLEADVRERDATIDALRQSTQAASGGWQPIETCPKGPNVLFWYATTNQPYMGWWDKHQAIPYASGGITFGTLPTHWQHVEPPK